MWYRVAKYKEDKKYVEHKFVDSRVLADMVADHEQFDIETKNAWIKLIDEGECYA